MYGAYRDSTEIKRLKSVNLDRKLSATARVPQRSTVVESPSGRIANSDGRESRGADVSSVHADSPYNQGEYSAGSDAPAHSEISAVPSSNSGTMSVIRPPFARNNTSVCIVSGGENTIAQSSEHLSADGRDADTAFPDEDGVTLADIPLLVEAEQVRMERGRTPMREGRPLLSELTVLESLILKHFALLALQRSPLAHLIDTDETLELMEVKKNGWWNKIFKPGKDKKDLKKKGEWGHVRRSFFSLV